MSPKLDSLLIHARTRAELERFTAHPAHALLILGPAGSGKTELSKSLAAELLNTGNIDNYPYFFHITRPEDKKEIPIDDIRNLLRQLRLKTPGQQGLRRMVFIEDAHFLSGESQNALLKALEEPAGDTGFILSTHSDRSVLPTIASRAQRLYIQPATLNQAQKFYQAQKTEAEINAAWQLSQGSPGLLHALLFDSDGHPLKNAVDLAKNLLRETPYERVLELDKLSKDKEQLAVVLSALAKVLAALHRSAINKGGSPSALALSRRLVQKLQKALAENVSPRLVALELALNLKV